jgi:hypothetical protein
VSEVRIQVRDAAGRLSAPQPPVRANAGKPERGGAQELREPFWMDLAAVSRKRPFADIRSSGHESAFYGGVLTSSGLPRLGPSSHNDVLADQDPSLKEPRTCGGTEPSSRCPCGSIAFTRTVGYGRFTSLALDGRDCELGPNA